MQITPLHHEPGTRQIRYICEHFKFIGKGSMKPPRPTRLTGNLPVRIPGNARPAETTPAQDEASESELETPAPPDTNSAPRTGIVMPRLTQFSSLGSRGDNGRLPTSSFAQKRTTAAARFADGLNPGFGAPDDENQTSDTSITVLRRPADRDVGGGTRATGSRGAIAVVGIVGLLAAGGVGVTLALASRDHGDQRDGKSTTVSSREHHSEDIEGLDIPPIPTALASHSATDKHGKTATPTKESTSSSPARQSPGTASGSTAATPTTPVSSPGVNIFSHASRRCIDIVGGKAVQGARLMISSCSRDVPTQHWSFASNGTMRGLGMCVQLAEGSTADGADLEMAACNGRAAQQFRLNAQHDLVSVLADKCVDVRDNGTANGTRLQLWSCGGTDNQKWSSA
ncbi:RICIN domain-containing protein [Streptomyces fructofermentans]|uniref:RICIN domain-containing protein n=1 Tax=Streptomyces fructofermentans TaxID=152141 RepID=UPI0034095BA3